MAVFWLVALTVSVTVVTYLRSYFTRRRKKFPPGPYGLPLVGYLPFMARHAPRAYIAAAKKYGSVFSVKIGRTTWVVLGDNDSIREALVERGNEFSGRFQFYMYAKTSGGLGVLFRDYSDVYTSQRKFAHITLRSLERTYAAEKITEEFSHFSSAIQFQSNKAFDCQDALLNATCNILSSMFFGSRFSYDDKRLKKITTILNMGFKDKSHSRNVALLTFVPEMRYFPPFSSSYKRVVSDADSIKAIIRNIVKEHKNSSEADNPRDFISEYLREIRMKGGKDESFHEEQLIEILRDFFVGGTGTITGTLRWCVLCFATYPEIQGRLWEEIHRIVGSETPSMRHEDKLPYTNAFLQEIMRHRTVVPLGVPHTPTKDLHFRGFNLPKGTPIITNVWAAHFDPKYFNNAKEFNPDRFLDSDGNFIKSKHVMPFAAGPRRCLGEELGRMTLFLFLVNVIKAFEIQPSPQHSTSDFHEGLVGNAHVPFPFVVSFLPR